MPKEPISHPHIPEGYKKQQNQTLANIKGWENGLAGRSTLTEEEALKLYGHGTWGYYQEGYDHGSRMREENKKRGG
jgi:hypothetical protein